MSSIMPTYGSPSISFERGEGIYLYSTEGKKYMDFCSQLVNCNAGHQHEEIISSIKKQADELSYIGPAFTIDIRAKLGKKLSEIIPGSLNASFFSSDVAKLNEMPLFNCSLIA